MGNRFNKPIGDQQGGARASSSSVGKIVTPNLKVFTFAELKSATKNFQPAKMLGDDGNGRFYKGWIDETLTPSKSGVGMAVIVKKYSPDSHQGINQWKTEVNFLGKFSHPNLVRLIGYCEKHDNQFLVYEYLLNGSLEDHLFNRKARAEPLPWGTRIRIAMDVARGLDFLHNNPEDTVIYRDVKPANISLDEKYGAKLSNFELATMGPSNDDSHMSTEVQGTYGYAAPEYIATGHLYVKSDVYGFGVVLLEILTGLRNFDRNRPSSEHNLAEKYKPILHNRGKLKKMIDPRMGEYPPEGAHKLALLIKRCLEKVPESRPSISEVLVLLERISTISVKPKKPKGSS